MLKLNYVLGIVTDPVLGFTVGITKKKGPLFLLNKVTFPGGKMEGDESPAQAMSREMLEEVGLRIPAEDWTLFDTLETDDYVLHKLAAVSDKVIYARQLEEEPVWHLETAASLKYAKSQPDQFAPDFIKTLESAIACTH